MSARTITRGVLAAAAGLTMLAAAAPVGAQDPELTDGRWLPYMGCWVEQGATDGPMTCVTPAEGGVAFLTVAGDQVTDRRVVRGDDVARPAEVPGCTGVESARFSADGHRVFTESRLTCGSAERNTRGLMAMVAPDRWIEVQALVGQGPSSAWVKDYTPAPASRITAAELGPVAAVGSSRAVTAARMAAAARIRVDAIIEATARTDPEAVKAWIAEQGEPLRLDADRLVQLADAGVPPEVIDVAVAVSFPDRFAVARQPQGEMRPDRGRASFGYARYGAWSMWSPWSPYYSPFYMDRYWGYGYYGYYPYNRYDRWGYTPYSPYGPSVVVVRPVTRPGDGYTQGRVVKGRGFVPSSGTARGTATRPNNNRVSRPSSSRTSSSSSAASTTRKAKRRTGGGGGGL
jgi:hypothetical protein